MAVKPIPEGFHTVTPYIIAEGAEKLIEFLQKGLGATMRFRKNTPDGKLMHAEVKIGDSIVMLGGACPEFKAIHSALYLYVPDCDALYAQAMAAGAESMNAPRDEFYGDRVGGIKDPSGNTWWFATHKEDVSPEEMDRRAKEAFAKREKK